MYSGIQSYNNPTYSGNQPQYSQLNFQIFPTGAPISAYIPLGTTATQQVLNIFAAQHPLQNGQEYGLRLSHSGEVVCSINANNFDNSALQQYGKTFIQLYLETYNAAGSRQLCVMRIKR